MTIITLNDKNKNWDQASQYYRDANSWALENCASYDGHEVIDVSDFSYEHDLLAQYTFKNEQDSFMFILRWA